jgi:signal transduction histidine kinase
MGLAIARGIVEAHGGNISIEDVSQGHGTRIVFTVPVGDDEQAPGEDEESRILATADIGIAENLKGDGE